MTNKQFLTANYGAPTGFIFAPYPVYLGDTDVQQKLILLKGGGAATQAQNDGVWYAVFLDLMTVEECIWFSDKGCTVIRPGLAIAVDDLDDLVPSDLFGAMVDDEDGEAVNITWAEWMRPTYTYTEGHVLAAANTGNIPTFSDLDPVRSSLRIGFPKSE